MEYLRIVARALHTGQLQGIQTLKGASTDGEDHGESGQQRAADGVQTDHDGGVPSAGRSEPGPGAGAGPGAGPAGSSIPSNVVGLGSGAPGYSGGDGIGGMAPFGRWEPGGAGGTPHPGGGATSPFIPV